MDGGILTTINSVVTVVGNGSTIEPAQGLCRRFFVVEAAGSLYLNNLTLRGGCNTTSGGGALLANGGYIYITDSTFVGNTTNPWNGGAILANPPSAFEIEDSTFDSNTTTSFGGAIYSSGADLVIRRSSFVSNYAESEGGALGIEGNIRIDNSTFTNNSAGYGGAILGWFGTGLISFSTFNGNIATAGSVAWFQSGNFTLANNLFLHSVGGGPAFNCESDPNYANLTFKYSNISDDFSCGSSEVIASPLQVALGQFGNYEAQTTFYPLEPNSVAIAAANCLTADDVEEDTDQRGVARPIYQGHCDPGAFETDGTTYPAVSPPALLGAGNLLISNGILVSEYTRDGTRVRDFWPSLQAPSVGSVVGVDADGLNAFGIFHGRVDTDFGHYTVSTDTWTSMTAPSWTNYYGSANTMIVRAGEHWFLTGIAGNCQCEIVVFNKTGPLTNLMIGSEINDMKVGQDGLLYVLTGSTVSSFNPETLAPQKTIDLSGAAQGYGIGALAVGKQGEFYIYRPDSKILKLDSQGTQIASIDCVVPANPTYTCFGARTIALSADQHLFVMDGDGQQAPAVVLDFDSNLVDAPSSSFTLPVTPSYNNGQFALSPLPIDEIFTDSFE